MRRKMGLADIGRGLGISRQRVFALRKRGMPVDSIAAARQWRSENMDAEVRRPDPRGVAAADVVAHGDHKRRLVAAQAEREELKLRVERGELVRRDVEEKLSRRLAAAIVGALDAIPDRIAAECGTDGAQRDRIRWCLSREIDHVRAVFSRADWLDEGGTFDA